MKLLYKPVSLAAKLVGARAGKQAFDKLWSGVSDEPKPEPGEPGVSFAKVVGAAALEGAILAAVAAAVNLAAARIFHHFIGTWPAQRSRDAQPSHAG